MYDNLKMTKNLIDFAIFLTYAENEGNLQGGLTLKNYLKQKMKKGPVFGMTVCSGSPAVIEMMAMCGLDFAFIDTEHNPRSVGQCTELVLACRAYGNSPLLRVTRADEVEIRKALEIGSEGVIVPHIKTVEEMQTCVRGAKFPPIGRRGIDIGVRSDCYGLETYEGSDYRRYSNDTELVIPMAEDFEFIDNVEDLMSVPGIDAINFGPADLSNSIDKFNGYDMEKGYVAESLAKIRVQAEKRGIGIMAPAGVTAESAQKLIDKGVTMVLMSSDYNIWRETMVSIGKEINRLKGLK